MWNSPALAVLSRWVPPQNSKDSAPIFTTRTVSPYFSPKRAVAPSFFASSKGRTSVSTAVPERMAPMVSSSMRFKSSREMAS